MFVHVCVVGQRAVWGGSGRCACDVCGALDRSRPPLTSKQAEPRRSPCHATAQDAHRTNTHAAPRARTCSPVSPPRSAPTVPSSTPADSPLAPNARRAVRYCCTAAASRGSGVLCCVCVCVTMSGSPCKWACARAQMHAGAGAIARRHTTTQRHNDTRRHTTTRADPARPRSAQPTLGAGQVCLRRRRLQRGAHGVAQLRRLCEHGIRINLGRAVVGQERGDLGLLGLRVCVGGRGGGVKVCA
jgi:hypothetical protein